MTAPFKEVFLVVGERGHYEDRSMWTVAVFPTRPMADVYVNQLNRVESRAFDEEGRTPDMDALEQLMLMDPEYERGDRHDTTWRVDPIPMIALGHPYVLRLPAAGMESSPPEQPTGKRDMQL